MMGMKVGAANVNSSCLTRYGERGAWCPQPHANLIFELKPLEALDAR
jgi:hypothetical protein